MDDPVYEKLTAVRDSETFLAFLKELMNDLPAHAATNDKDSMGRYLQGVGGWMNHDLWSFLEAAIAGGQDNKIGTDAECMTAQQAWRSAAEIVYCGKIYE